MQTIPSIEAQHLLAFCSQLEATSQPRLVACRPRFDRRAKECFSIVEEQISIQGGSMALGWAIWEWPKVFIEAEFHAVWVSPSGEFIDMNPRAILASSIVFLPTPSLRYEGKQVDNIRKPLTQDKDLIRFLFTFKRQFEILNRGDRAFQHAVSLPPKDLKELQLLQKEGARLERRLQIRYGTEA